MKKVQLGIFEELFFALGTRPIGCVFPISDKEMIAATQRGIFRFVGSEILESANYSFSCACYIPEVDLIVAHSYRGSKLYVMMPTDLSHPIAADLESGHMCVYHMIYARKTRSVALIGAGIRVLRITWRHTGARLLTCNSEVAFEFRSKFADNLETSLLNQPAFDEETELLYLPTPDGIFGFNLDGERMIQVTTIPSDATTVFAFCKESKKIVTADAVNGICLWKSKAKIKKKFNLLSAGIIAIAFVDEENIVCMSTSYALYLMNLRTGRFFLCYTTDRRPSRFLMTQLYSKPYIAISRGNKLALLNVYVPWHVWNLNIMKPSIIYRCPKLNSAARILVTTDNSFVKLYNPRKSCQLTAATPSETTYPSSFFYDRGIHINPIYNESQNKYDYSIIETDPTGKCDNLFLIYQNGTICNFNPNKAPAEEYWMKHLNAKFMTKILYKGEWKYAIAHFYGFLSIVDMNTFETIRYISISKDEIIFMLYHHRTKSLVFMLKKQLKILDYETENFIFEMDIETTPLGYIYGNILYLAYKHGHIFRYQFKKNSLEYVEPEIIIRPHSKPVTAIDFGPSYYISSSLDSTAIIWNYHHNKIIQVILPFPIYSIAFYGPKRNLLIGMEDEIMFISGKELFDDDKDEKIDELDNYDQLNDIIDPKLVAEQIVVQKEIEASKSLETFNIEQPSNKKSFSKALAEYRERQKQDIQNYLKLDPNSTQSNGPNMEAIRQKKVDMMCKLLGIEEPPIPKETYIEKAKKYIKDNLKKKMAILALENSNNTINNETQNKYQEKDNTLVHNNEYKSIKTLTGDEKFNNNTKKKPKSKKTRKLKKDSGDNEKINHLNNISKSKRRPKEATNSAKSSKTHIKFSKKKPSKHKLKSEIRQTTDDYEDASSVSSVLSQSSLHSNISLSSHKSKKGSKQSKVPNNKHHHKLKKNRETKSGIEKALSKFSAFRLNQSQSHNANIVLSNNDKIEKSFLLPEQTTVGSVASINNVNELSQIKSLELNNPINLNNGIIGSPTSSNDQCNNLKLANQALFKEIIFTDKDGNIFDSENIYINEFGNLVDEFDDAILVQSHKAEKEKPSKNNISKRDFGNLQLRIKRVKKYFHPNHPRFRPATPPPIRKKCKNHNFVTGIQHIKFKKSRSKTPLSRKLANEYRIPPPNFVLDWDAVFEIYGRGHIELLPLIERFSKSLNLNSYIKNETGSNIIIKRVDNKNVVCMEQQKDLNPISNEICQNNNFQDSTPSCSNSNHYKKKAECSESKLNIDLDSKSEYSYANSETESVPDKEVTQDFPQEDNTKTVSRSFSSNSSFEYDFSNDKLISPSKTHNNQISIDKDMLNCEKLTYNKSDEHLDESNKIQPSTCKNENNKEKCDFEMDQNLPTLDNINTKESAQVSKQNSGSHNENKIKNNNFEFEQENMTQAKASDDKIYDKHDQNVQTLLYENNQPINSNNNIPETKNSTVDNSTENDSIIVPFEKEIPNFESKNSAETFPHNNENKPLTPKPPKNQSPSEKHNPRVSINNIFWYTTSKTSPEKESISPRRKKLKENYESLKSPNDSKKGNSFEILGVPTYRKDITRRKNNHRPSYHVDERPPVSLRRGFSPKIKNSNQRRKKLEAARSTRTTEHSLVMAQYFPEYPPELELHISNQDKSNSIFKKRQSQNDEIQNKTSEKGNYQNYSPTQQLKLNHAKRKTMIKDYSYMLEPSAEEEPQTLDTIGDTEDKYDILFSLRSLFPKTNKMSMIIKSQQPNIEHSRDSSKILVYRSDRI